MAQVFKQPTLSATRRAGKCVVDFDRKAKRELTERLSNAVGTNEHLIEELRDYCLHHKDPAVQVAAIIGLEKIGSKRAVLALTERVLDDGAWHPSERPMEALSTLVQSGGLLALTATFLSDSRCVHPKLTLLYDGAKRLRRQGVARSLEAIYRQAGTKYNLQELVPEVHMTLERIPLADISKGAVLAGLFRPLPVWVGDVPVPDDAKAERVIAYCKLRVPGLAEILGAQHNSGI
ncbi:MAG: hypothetical protein M1482_16275 [Chloroflexi bacterium]|nr:hypothetical protein [Chloroflexota bacterium]